jgi:hypothetical protein
MGFPAFPENVPANAGIAGRKEEKGGVEFI